MNNENRFCVYLHRRKDNNEVFYVGSGTVLRPYSNTRTLDAWNKVIVESNGHYVEICEENLTKAESLLKEQFYIEKHKETVVNNKHSSSFTKEMSFEEFNERFYIDSTSPTGLRYKVNVYAHDYGDIKYSLIHKENDVAGVSKVDGWSVCFKKKNYRVARIVWLLNFGTIDPSLVVDHISGNDKDNRIENLRIVDWKINRRNLKKDLRNSTGITGVAYSPYNQTYRASVSEDGYKRMSRSFSISKYGLIPAFYLACQWRKEQIAILNANGAGYSKRHGT